MGRGAGALVQSMIEPGYMRTPGRPSTSDSTNQSVADQWPALQKAMMGWAGAAFSLSASSCSAALSISAALPSSNQFSLSRLTAPGSVPRACAASAAMRPLPTEACERP